MEGFSRDEVSNGALDLYFRNDHLLTFTFEIYCFISLNHTFQRALGWDNQLQSRRIGGRTKETNGRVWKDARRTTWCLRTHRRIIRISCPDSNISGIPCTTGKQSRKEIKLISFLHAPGLCQLYRRHRLPCPKYWCIKLATRHASFDSVKSTRSLRQNP